MQGSRASWRAHNTTPGAALGSGSGSGEAQQPRPTTSTRPYRDSGRYSRDEEEGEAEDREEEAARAAAAALALASEPTIEKMVPIPNHPGRVGHQHQHQQQGEHVVEGCTLPDASLVARGALKSGYLWKMGANVPRWKRRFFVLKPITMLFYYMSEHDTEPRGCIDLDLFDAVRKVREEGGGGVGSAAGGFSATPGDGETGKRRRRSPRTTTFELYRSGCPDGSGFMLEARGDEDWEQWVESIADGRHGKMRAEMDVMKGANKLLLEEINGLEQQVATFRGYADQRHVTVLALRDERHRNGEVAAELAALADTASALSHLISQSVKDDQQQQKQEPGGTALAEEAHDAQRQPWQLQQRFAELIDAPEVSPSLPSREARETDFDWAPRAAALQSHERRPPPPAATARAGDGDRHSQELCEQRAEERLSFEAVRRALAEARSELGRKSRALRQETGRRRAAEGRVRHAEGLARAAGNRAEAAEAATARANGRVNVLERNVEYLQAQQRALRADLCQSRHKTQLARAQKAVLKREVRDMWSRHASLSSRGPPSPPNPDDRGAPLKHHHGREQGRGGAGGEGGEPQSVLSRCQARAWASMSDLTEAGVSSPPSSVVAGGAAEGVGSRGAEDPASLLVARPSNRRRAMTGASAGSFRRGGGCLAGAHGEDEGKQNIRNRQRVGSMRSCLSGESLTAASDGGETDFADRTNSEASDFEDESTRFPSHSSRETGAGFNGGISPFRESVCRTIRKRVGPPQVPPLPPTRHRLTLTAVERLRSFSGDAGEAEATQQPQLHQQPEGTFGGGADDSGGGGGSGSGASSAVAGLGVAGMFLGLRKGMVDKAAQEMGKKLALWPGAGMPSVGSLGSLAAGAISGATGGNNNNAAQSGIGSSSGGGVGGGLHPQTPVGSPRSASASFSTALTDSPVRWDPPSRHGSTASTDPGSDAVVPAPATLPVPGEKDGEAVDCSIPAPQELHLVPASGAATDATPALAPPLAVGGSGLPRVGSVSSRTALIQLSDLELAEPCGRRIGGEGGAPACGGGGGDSRKSPIAPSRASSSSLPARSVFSARRRLSTLLPPRPDDEYELVFSSRVIGLQFKELPDGTGVYVTGSDGYVGPAPTTGVPGERLCPDNGDVLESYNGISALGKSADVVAGELARCGRPLRLGFRWARAEVIAEEAAKEQPQEEEVGWAAAYGDGGGSGGGGPWGGGTEAGAGGSSCRDHAAAFPAPSHSRAVSS